MGNKYDIAAEALDTRACPERVTRMLRKGEHWNNRGMGLSSQIHATDYITRNSIAREDPRLARLVGHLSKG